MSETFEPNPEYEHHGFIILRNFIPEFMADYFKNYLETLRLTDKMEQGDGQVAQSDCIYGDPALDTFMAMSTSIISNAIGRPLLPTYTYSRIYKHGATLDPHTDRSECEHSVSISFGGEYDAIWPMWLIDPEVHGSPHVADLYPGDCVVYKGTKLTHWRQEFLGKSQYQTFMHYVDANGVFKDRLYDTRPYLGMRASTKR
jgi:hypothetical protein